MKDWNRDLSNIWAKSPLEGKVEGESIETHTYRVLCHLHDLVELRPWLSRTILNTLFWAAFFHDWGKSARGFQKMVRGGKKWHHRHEVLSLVFIEWIECLFSENEKALLIAAIASHHKDFRELNTLYPPGFSLEEDSLSELIHELEEDDIKTLWYWFDRKSKIWIKELGFDKIGVKFPENTILMEEAIKNIKENGVEIIRRYLQLYKNLFVKIEEKQQDVIISGIYLRGSMIKADHVGSANIGRMQGLDISAKKILSGLNKKLDDLYKHQKESLKTQTSAILRAPTGSGKTEAALLWSAGQGEQGASKLFYTLPYQASMNAMYDRLNSQFANKVGLLHSRSVFALYRRFMEQEYLPVKAAEEARKYKSLAKMHLFPIQIFSPYQMLKVAFQLKGYETMLVDFSGSAFIYDEIHAYDPNRLALIVELTSFLREKFKARFFVMSATLPSVIQSRFMSALGNPQKISASESLFKKFIRHKVGLLDGELLDKSNLSKIITSFRQGKSILVTCNTVRRAKEAYGSLINEIPEEAIILVHSRFNSQDRLLKENKIIEKTGLGGRDLEPVVVVSTQVVEVSLNIDLDILYSDPAPLEALLQRFGRINRNCRLESAPVYIFKNPDDGSRVYHENLVKKALEILNQYADGRLLNEEKVPGWLDLIYTDNILAQWEEKYQSAANEFREAFIDRIAPFRTGDDLSEAFNRLFNGVEILPAQMEKEYFKSYTDSPLDSYELLVPISWFQWEKIKKSRQVISKQGQWPPVVDVAYSKDTGLD